MQVRSAVIDWQDKALTITDTTGAKHTISWEKEILVTMKGYPDRETKTMAARDLGPYMSRGYIIEQIEVKG